MSDRYIRPTIYNPKKHRVQFMEFPCFEKLFQKSFKILFFLLKFLESKVTNKKLETLTLYVYPLKFTRENATRIEWNMMELDYYEVK